MPEFNLKIVIAHRNRSLNLLPTGEVLTLFPNLVQSLNAACGELELADPELRVSLLVVDAGARSDGAPLAGWLPASARFPVRLIDASIAEAGRAFNKGRLLNLALASISEPGPVFVCDTDMLLSARLLQRIRKHVEAGDVFAPVCWSRRSHAGADGWWRDTGSGMIAFNWTPEDQVRYVEKDTWGGEDWLFISALRARGLRVVRENADIIHQWHPPQLGWGA